MVSNLKYLLPYSYKFVSWAAIYIAEQIMQKKLCKYVFMYENYLWLKIAEAI